MIKNILFILLMAVSSVVFAQDSRLQVYVVLAEDCPICNYMGPTLSETAEIYKDEVSFYAVFPVKRSNYKTINTFKKKYELEGYESILDKDQSISRGLNATVTPEIIITDSDENILYRGRINDAYTAPGKRQMKHPSRELEYNIRTLLRGKKIPQPWPEAIGCYITYLKKENQH